MPAIPIAVAGPTAMFLRYTRKPKIMASTIKSREIIAVERLASSAAPSLATPAEVVEPKVFATIEAKAATTRSRVR